MWGQGLLASLGVVGEPSIGVCSWTWHGEGRAQLQAGSDAQALGQWAAGSGQQVGRSCPRRQPGLSNIPGTGNVHGCPWARRCPVAPNMCLRSPCRVLAWLWAPSRVHWAPSRVPHVFAEQPPGTSSAWGWTTAQTAVDTHLCCLAAWAGCAVALPLPRALLTPALAPADLSDLGARHQWLQGQEGLTFQPALAGAPARGLWEPGWEGHRAVVSASFLSTADLPVG